MYLSSRPSPPSSLLSYPFHHSQLKPTSAPYSGPLDNSSLVGHTPLLGHPLISSSSSSINSVKSAGSARNLFDGYSHSRQTLPSDYYSLTRHSRLQGPLSSTPSYHTTMLHGDGMETRKPSTRARYTASSLSDHTPSSLSDHTEPPHHDRTLSSQHRTLTPSAPGLGVGHDKLSTTQTPSRSEPSSPDVELQRSKLKVKQLEREVRWKNAALLLLKLVIFSCC